MTEIKTKYGCHCDIESMPEDFEPDFCVIDTGEYHLCIYAKPGKQKEDCEYWREFTPKSNAGNES